MALGSEPDILPALRQAFERGAKIAFPIVDGNAIRVGVVTSLSDENSQRMDANRRGHD